ncbi:OLC1v1013835C1 [Oldenlandia corymbosa var. corymbosa]|uniref:OLC1v1013835C1 n=1 Tax=Oldenlandia corymbosa var. corymbosa TaxID=529605 RepID=A0AAV1DZP5_OLDCO|nr:OLC1v1013835C1 [Oldenlandia corymbosa var. corymbosa]
MAAKQETVEPKIPEILLNSGHKMPVIGFGCAANSIPPLDEMISILLKAMEIGYRHFDTASLYGSEEALGKAVAKALEIGLIKNRDELFITSKLWITHTHPDLVLPALKQTLKTMGLEYLDLYLIHWPLRIKEGADPVKLEEGDALPFDMIVNQVEMNVNWQQRKLVPFCKAKGIHVCAWSPLGASGTIWGSNAVLENQVLKDIAASRNKTIAQVALRWIYEKGVTLIVKSFNEERMKQNLQIFYWELSKEEKDQILCIPQHRGPVGRGDLFIVKNGPIKSVEELWDGDI